MLTLYHGMVYEIRTMSWFTDTLAFFGKKKEIDNVPQATSYGTYIDSTFSSKGPKSFDEAMAISAVFKCARIIGETFGSFKCELYTDQDGTSRPYKEHSLYPLLKMEPHPLYSSMTFFETAAMHVAVEGNHYAYMHEDQNGQVISLDMLNPMYMMIFTWNGKLWYRDQKNHITYSQDEIIHVKGPSKDGLYGMTPIRYVNTSYTAANASGEYVSDIYENGSFIGGVLMTDKVLNPNQEKKLAQSWRSAYSGKGNHGKVAVLEDGVKFQEVKMSPQDLDIINTKKYQDADIAGHYRVPLHLLNALERSTNNNIEQQDIDFAKHCMRPYVKRFEQEYNRKLIRRDRRGIDYIKFNMDSLLRGDSKARSEFYKTMYYIDGMTSNEIRISEKRPPVEGGDELYSQKMARLGVAPKNTGENGTQNKQ